MSTLILIFDMSFWREGPGTRAAAESAKGGGLTAWSGSASESGTNLKWTPFGWQSTWLVWLTYMADPEATLQTCGGQHNSGGSIGEGVGGQTKTALDLISSMGMEYSPWGRRLLGFFITLDSV